MSIAEPFDQILAAEGSSDIKRAVEAALAEYDAAMAGLNNLDSMGDYVKKMDAADVMLDGRAVLSNILQKLAQ